MFYFQFIYRLNHNLFHIGLVINQRPKIKSRGANMGWGMKTIQISKKSCFNLFTSIMYLQLIDLTICTRLKWDIRPGWYDIITLVGPITSYKPGGKLLWSLHFCFYCICKMCYNLAKYVINNGKIWILSCLLYHQSF